MCAIYTDAAGSRGEGSSLGDLYIQGVWSKVAFREGINWNELWVIMGALGHWRLNVKRKLVLARGDNATAVAYADHGAGRSGQLTMLARDIKEREVVS